MKHSKRSPGFSLILSLTVMAGIVMLLVTVSAFITVESRTVMNQQLATRARLNSIVSMRLALAHLQQEAGPDRRATARADITQPDATASNVRNPMWTGIWRTDLPDLPPSWIISGRGDQPAGTQSISLYQTSVTPDYHAGYWAPWQSGYAPTFNQLVTLVGLGSALGQDGSTPSGIVSLPKVALPDDDIAGSYAYWVGDEGVKARPNLLDTRAKTDTNSADQLISVRSPVTHGLLKNLPIQTQLLELSRLKEAPLLTGWDPVVTGGGALDTRKYFHDISLVSAGVLADPVNGGLKRDLSVAFELSDAEFAKTEFGGGATNAAGTATEKGLEPVTMPVLTTTFGLKELTATPIFSRTVADGQVRGPTWWALRDYHRLYKQLGWSGGGSGGRTTTTPTLLARATWPNNAAAHPDEVGTGSGIPASGSLTGNSLRRRYYGYSDLYNGDLPPSINPAAQDRVNGQSGMLVTRPLRAAASPYVQRVTLAFSVNKMQWFVWKSIKIGKNVMWYQEEWVDIRLNVTPIVVMHNPYNVRMTLQPNALDLTKHKNPNNANDATGKPYKQAHAVAISFADLAGWKFRFKQYQAGSLDNPFVYETPLSDFFHVQSGTPIPIEPYFTAPYESDNEDTFRLYLSTDDANPTITLEPGELRSFSCAALTGDWSKSVVLNNAFDTRGGFRDNVFDWNFGKAATDTFDIDSPIAFEIIPGGNMRMRHAVASNPEDQLYRDRKVGKLASEIAGDNEDFIRLSSEASEVVFSDINSNKYPSPGEKFFASWRHVRDKYPRPDPKYDGRTPYPTPTSPPLEPDLVTVIDIAAKTADESGAPYPLLTHSNPFAASARSSGAGRNGNGANNGFLGTSPSYQLTLRSGSWLNVLASTDSGRLAFGGNATSAYGTQKAILTEVPLVQPTTLAQYAHANFGVRDQQPLLSIGNSFASPFIQNIKVIQDNGPSWSEHDQTYLLNAALWDGYFLSSLAPWMKTGSTGAVTAASPTHVDFITPATAADPNEAKSMTLVIDDFVNNDKPLDNPRFSIERSSRVTTDTAKALNDYRRSASVLLNKGAFNVNSTSPIAWQTFLGSAKKLAIGDKGPSTPDDTTNARFPRVLAKGTASVAGNNLNDASNWAGFANLSDAQITNLANAIVAENKARFAIQTRGERDLIKAPGARLFGGLAKPATPYLGLSEFINRFLTPETWASRCGALQASILRADQTYNAGLSDRLFANAPDRKVTQTSLQTATAGSFPNAENIEVIAQNGTSRAHTAMGAPGNLLQSDLLQSLGSALTSRSDTFTLRCFGEASQRNGEAGYAWIEAIVQRVPDFIDTTNAPETGNSVLKPLVITPHTPMDDSKEAALRTDLTPVNNVLGRRFKVVSLRWLKADEL
jgi:hypothetical protein